MSDCNSKETNSTHTENNQRIVKNSFLMVVRMSILMLINLVAVRFVRSGLGIESYGLLNAIIGLVHLLSSLGVVLSASSQRFLSIALGERDIQKMEEFFSTSLQIGLYFILIVILSLETIGLWFVITRMNYPASEFRTVMWIYQFSIITLAITLLQVPFIASIIAHEHIHTFALVSLSEAILKLLIALALPYITTNKLIIYVGLLMFISLISTSIYIAYCHNHFDECQHFIQTNKHIRSMLSFTTWTLFGSIAGSALIQGNMLLLNIFYGPISNAAFSIAIHIYSAITLLGNNIFVAIRSRMIQSYANKQYDYLNNLFIFSEKALMWMLIVICIPIYCLMPEILRIWLGDTDIETINCSRGMLLAASILVLNNPITIIMQATGHIKPYHLLIEPIILLSLPASYIMLKHGYPSYYTCYSIILFCTIAHFVRLERLKRFYPSISYSNMLKQLFIPIGFSKVERNFIASFFHRF